MQLTAEIAALARSGVRIPVVDRAGLRDSSAARRKVRKCRRARLATSNETR
jgi:hypothetical protein